MKGLVTNKLRHRVGQLNFPAGPFVLPIQNAHDIGLENIAA